MKIKDNTHYRSVFQVSPDHTLSCEGNHVSSYDVLCFSVWSSIPVVGVKNKVIHCGIAVTVVVFI